MSQSLIVKTAKIEHVSETHKKLKVNFEYEVDDDSAIKVTVSHAGEADPDHHEVKAGRGTATYGLEIRKPTSYQGPVTVTFRLGGAYHVAYV